jgi:hypothetical protein
MERRFLVFSPAAAIALAYYYSGPNQLLSLPKEYAFRAYRATYVIKDEEQLECVFWKFQAARTTSGSSPTGLRIIQE